MKLNLPLCIVTVLLHCLNTSASFHSCPSRAQKRSANNSVTPEDIFVHDPTESPAVNLTNICIATYVGENTTIVTKLEYLSSNSLKTPTEILNKSQLISQLVHVCDPDCEQKFNAGIVYVNNHSLEEPHSFLEYYANFRCIDEEPMARGTSYDYYLRIVSVCFICLCVLSYSFYLVKYIIDKSLRTVPGSCILSFCIAALAIYPCFFAVKITSFDGRTIFVCGLYIFTTLANWFWINALTFDLWISIRMATVKLRRISTRSLVLRFIYYSIYSWGIPSVLTFIIVHPFSSPFSYHCGCYNQDRRHAKLFIICPFVILQLLNFALFYSSFYMIFKGSKSRSQRERKEASNLKQNFIFYLKFSCFVAVIWIFGIAGYITKYEILTYVLLHAKILEGPFIVWTFTMTGRARETCVKFSPLLRISTRDYQVTKL